MSRTLKPGDAVASALFAQAPVAMLMSDSVIPYINSSPNISSGM